MRTLACGRRRRPSPARQKSWTPLWATGAHVEIDGFCRIFKNSNLTNSWQDHPEIWMNSMHTARRTDFRAQGFFGSLMHYRSSFYDWQLYREGYGVNTHNGTATWRMCLWINSILPRLRLPDKSFFRSLEVDTEPCWKAKCRIFERTFKREFNLGHVHEIETITRTIRSRNRNNKQKQYGLTQQISKICCILMGFPRPCLLHQTAISKPIKL